MDVFNSDVVYVRARCPNCGNTNNPYRCSNNLLMCPMCGYYKETSFVHNDYKFEDFPVIYVSSSMSV